MTRPRWASELNCAEAGVAVMACMALRALPDVRELIAPIRGSFDTDTLLRDSVALAVRAGGLAKRARNG